MSFEIEAPLIQRKLFFERPDPKTFLYKSTQKEVLTPFAAKKERAFDF